MLSLLFRSLYCRLPTISPPPSRSDTVATTILIAAVTSVFVFLLCHSLSNFLSFVCYITPLCAEAQALREGVFFASSLGIKSLEVESDCEQLIHACTGKVRRKAIDQILEDIKSIKHEFTWIRFSWISRDANTVADLIAKLGSSNHLPQNWCVNPPEVLATLIGSELVVD